MCVCVCVCFCLSVCFSVSSSFPPPLSPPLSLSLSFFLSFFLSLSLSLPLSLFLSLSLSSLSLLSLFLFLSLSLRGFQVCVTRGVSCTASLLMSKNTDPTLATVMWKSWLFPCMRSSFWMRCWVPMKPLQRSCAKLKLHTRLTTHAAYLKLRP